MENCVDCIFADKCSVKVEQTSVEYVYRVWFYLGEQRKEIERKLDLRDKNIPSGIKKCLDHRL